MPHPYTGKKPGEGYCRAFVREDAYLRAKAVAMLCGMDVQDWISEAIVDKIAQDKIPQKLVGKTPFAHMRVQQEAIAAN
jgi:hypothetical protein